MTSQESIRQRLGEDHAEPDNLFSASDELTDQLFAGLGSPRRRTVARAPRLRRGHGDWPTHRSRPVHLCASRCLWSAAICLICYRF